MSLCLCGCSVYVPCFQTALPKSALGEVSRRGGIVDASWAGCFCTVIPAAGQSPSPLGVSVPGLSGSCRLVGSRVGFVQLIQRYPCELVTDCSVTPDGRKRRSQSPVPPISFGPLAQGSVSCWVVPTTLPPWLNPLSFPTEVGGSEGKKINVPRPGGVGCARMSHPCWGHKQL